MDNLVNCQPIRITRPTWLHTTMYCEMRVLNLVVLWQGIGSNCCPLEVINYMVIMDTDNMDTQHI